MNYNEMKLMVEAQSGGKNTVVLDNVGKPSIMVRIPKQTYASLGIGSSTAVHPAWKVNGVEKDFIYISKFQNIIQGGRAYSLPMQDPRAVINFDDAKAACDAKGPGWHIMTNAEWAAIALWCKANGFMPRGNNSFGADFSKPYERGVVTYTYEESGAIKNGRVATGSGPVTWAHDGTNDGIFDMNGNVWEWQGGLRIVDGEIQIIPDNNAAVSGADNSADSPLWKAIMPDGSLVAPGTSGTLHYDFVDNKWIISTSKTATHASYQIFESISAASGVAIPDIVKALALYPNGEGYDGDGFWCNNDGERVPVRGGDWGDGSDTGVFDLSLCTPRAHVGHNVGFRSSYYEL